MKEFFKYNRISFIILAIFILIGIFITLDYNNEYKKRVLYSDSIVQMYPELADVDFTYKDDTYNVFFTLLNESELMFFIQMLFPVLILIPLIKNMNKSTNTKEYEKIKENEQYYLYMRKKILKNYFSVLIMPIFLLCLFIFSYAYSRHFDVNYNILGLDFFSNYPILFTIIYIINVFLISIFYMNIALIMFRKIKDINLVIISSFLISFAFLCIMQLIGLLIDTMFNINIYSSIFNYLNVWNYTTDINIVGISLYVFILALVSSILIHLSYKVIQTKKGGSKNAEV